jgi:hypothetical protein
MNSSENYHKHKKLNHNLDSCDSSLTHNLVSYCKSATHYCYILDVHLCTSHMRLDVHVLVSSLGIPSASYNHNHHHYRDPNKRAILGHYYSLHHIDTFHIMHVADTDVAGFVICEWAMLQPKRQSAKVKYEI